MKLIVGLGNPGDEYTLTRHNLGFMLVDRLSQRAGVHRFRSESGARVAQAEVGGQRVFLAKPLTYMNLSGEAVLPLLEKYGEGDPSNLIVAVDDVALPFGMIRVRAQGAAGGQKGLKSIIDRLGTNRFARIRLGVKPDHPVSDLAGFVLSPVPALQREELERMLDRAAEAVTVMVRDGVEQAMTLFNERVKADIS